MFNKNLLAIATGAALLVGAQGALAGVSAPVTLFMDVQVVDTCAVSAWGNWNSTFNTADSYGVPAGDVQVMCAAGQPYRIMVDGGMNGTGLNRTMFDGSTGATMAYDLFDGLTGLPVGDNNPLDPAYLPMYTPASWAAGIDGTGTGAYNYHPLLANLYSTGVPGGYYSDMVAVTVTF